jgi:hypothetical protein
VLGLLCPDCEQRSRYGDGRICRACAGKLGEVKPDTVSAWISRGHLANVRYEGRSPMLWPAEVIQVAWDLHERERKRLALMASLVPDAQNVA